MQTVKFTFRVLMSDARRIVNEVNAGRLMRSYELKELIAARDIVRKHNHRVITKPKTRKYQIIPTDAEIALCYVDNKT